MYVIRSLGGVLCFMSGWLWGVPDMHPILPVLPFLFGIIMTMMD